MVSDALYNYRGKQVEISFSIEQDNIEAMFIDNDNLGVTIKGKDENDDDYIEYLPFRNILGIKMLTGSQLNPKRLDAGLEIEDSDDMKVRLMTAKVEREVSTLGKGYEVTLDEDSIEITDGDSNIIIDGDYDSLKVYDENAFEVSKKVATILGAKKITRDYQDEE